MWRKFDRVMSALQRSLTRRERRRIPDKRHALSVRSFLLVGPLLRDYMTVADFTPLPRPALRPHRRQADSWISSPLHEFETFTRLVLRIM